VIRRRQRVVVEDRSITPQSRMITRGGYYPQVSWWCIVIPTDLVDPSVVRTSSWTTLPAVLGRMAESRISMTSECLMCWCIFGKPGSVTENRIPTALYEIRHRAQTSEIVIWSCQRIVDIWRWHLPLHVESLQRRSSGGSILSMSSNPRFRGEWGCSKRIIYYLDIRLSLPDTKLSG